MGTLIMIVSLVVGMVVGILGGWLLFRPKKGFAKDDFHALELEKNSLSTKLESLAGELEKAVGERNEYSKRIIELEKELASFETEKKTLVERIANHKKDIDDLQGRFKVEFENLANKIFESHSTKFKTESESKIKDILGPLKDKLAEFQGKVETVYSDESRERFALKEEIKNIVEANKQITLEAKNLTLALKGDIKAQGTWGEMVLERILESSSLREGEEYTVQGKALGLVDDEGKRLKPDVIVNLPDEKHVIIDSKVSLTHYEKYTSEADSELKKIHLKDLLASIYTHIDGLNAKKYEHLEKLITPEFVLMFMPFEGAFSLAIQNDNALFSYAWDKRIVVVSPTTLLATLKTVASMWKHERQSRNAMEIARRGGQLYDKFVLLLKDLEDIESSFKKTTDLFLAAKNKLQLGKGNLIAQVDKIKQLGAKTSKEIPQQFISDAVDND